MTWLRYLPLTAYRSGRRRWCVSLTIRVIPALVILREKMLMMVSFP